LNAIDVLNASLLFICFHMQTHPASPFT